MNAMRVVPGQFKSFGHDYREDTPASVHAAFRLEAVTEDQMRDVYTHTSPAIAFSIPPLWWSFGPQVSQRRLATPLGRTRPSQLSLWSWASRCGISSRRGTLGS
jgi:hypothetical protein